jgi:REP element-mobilizing transposase RayT
MHFEEGYFYHVYNRSNQILFEKRENYLYFLEKFRRYISPYVDVIAWCLMPNHFHFMICPTKEATEIVKQKHLPNTQILSKQFGTYLSSYTKAINKQQNRRGNLFAHNTKAEKINEVILYSNQNKSSYVATCFRYIHNNPVEAKIVVKPGDWEFSSFIDFTGKRKGSLINKKLAMKIVNFDDKNFESWSNQT